MRSVSQNESGLTKLGHPHRKKLALQKEVDPGVLTATHIKFDNGVNMGI